MGDFNVREIRNTQDRAVVYQCMLDDIETLDRMLSDSVFDSEVIHIGAEQEMCIVDDQCRPTHSALQILDQIDDGRYTNELALYNLEANLNPHVLEKSCFADTENELHYLLNIGREAAEKFGHQIVLSGILPTLKFRHLDFEYMTPIQRYKTLSGKLAEMRGGKFEIYLQGVDDLIMSLPSVLFEACNTSFQLHLQIKAEEYVPMYNWSQMIAGPVLAMGVNSPILFGHELWSETRIAIFKQSLDTRSSSNQLRKKTSRVYFGTDWIYDSPTEILKEQAMRFPAIVTSDEFQKSSDIYNAGQIPMLRAMQLHNGTTYTWNRFCYGPQGKKPHLRIECRYLPSGPTAIDEVANFAFWVGLMNAKPEDWTDQFKNIDFKIVKNNFIKSARYGLDSVFDWFGEKYAATQLIIEKLIPAATNGLVKNKVDPNDIKRYMSIIEDRVHSGQNGSTYFINSFRKLKSKNKIDRSLQEITARSIMYQKENIPVHEWEIPKNYLHFNSQKLNAFVEDIMTSDLVCLREHDTVSMALSIFKWKPIHHLPIEKSNGDLVGMVTDGLMSRLPTEMNIDTPISEIMISNVIAVSSKDSVERAAQIMNDSELSCLPVIHDNKLEGLITRNDLIHFSDSTS